MFKGKLSYWTELIYNMLNQLGSETFTYVEH